MIHLTFPDGSVRDYKPGITGTELAASISKSLAKKAVALRIDGHLADLAGPIEHDATVKILTREDPEAQSRFLAIMQEQASRMARLVADRWHQGPAGGAGPRRSVRK